MRWKTRLCTVTKISRAAGDAARPDSACRSSNVGIMFGPSGMHWHAQARRSSAQVPYRLLKSFHKIQQRLVRELEKKFSGKDVVIIANRRIMAPTTSGQSNARPRSRTLTAVHEETLLDLCYPTGGYRHLGTGFHELHLVGAAGA